MPQPTAEHPSAPHRPTAAPAANDFAGGSYSERYRGTEWGRPDQTEEVRLAQTAKAGAQVGRGTILAGVGAVVVLVAVVGGVGSMMLSRFAPPPPRLVPVVATTLPPALPPTPSPDASTPGASVAPGRTGSPAPDVPWTPPRPIAGDPDGRGLARALTAAMADPSISYRIDWTGSMTYGNATTSLDVTIDADGDDLAGTILLNEGRVRFRADVVVKDGVGYRRPAGEPWSVDPTVMDGLSSSNPFGSSVATWDVLEYVGTVTRAGRTLHHLSTPGIDWQALSGFLLDENAAGFDVKQLRFDVFVEDNALPHSATLFIDGTTVAGGAEVDMTVDVSYRFSRFGDDFDIKAPTVNAIDPAG